ncbi:hypothetical protein AP285_04535 [Limnospira platensis YZ]|nr:hypothetical protein AP285_04535 [Arthrospira platensis YZ]BAI88867.1 hypothetical protein NIES39_B01100 [Arthrospira platensis NIES-39]
MIILSIIPPPLPLTPKTSQPLYIQSDFCQDAHFRRSLFLRGWVFPLADLAPAPTGASLF